MPLNGSSQPDPSTQPKHPHGNNRGLQQAYELRDFACKCASDLHSLPAQDLEEQATRAQALRNLSTVWDNSMERIRIIRGKPMPGSYRPERKPRSTRAKATLAPMKLPKESLSNPTVPTG